MNKTERSAFKSYFSSPEAMIIFTLIYLDGEIREEVLGIKEEFYESIKKAKMWRGRIASKIHPDKCHLPQSAEATAKLNFLYEEMVKHGD